MAKLTVLSWAVGVAFADVYMYIYIYIYIYDDSSDGRGRSLGVVRYSVWFYLVVYIEDSV